MHQKIFSSSLWLLAGNSAQQGIQLITFVLLARLLQPAVFGYVALASVVIDVAATVAVWGLMRIAQQRRGELTVRLLAHIHVFALFLALVLSLLIAAGVGVISVFYGFGLTCQLILMLIPILFIQAVRVAPEGAIYHSMEFKWLALRNNMAAFLGGGTAIALAFSGFEVYALVAQKLVAVTALGAVVWIAQGKRIHLLPLKQYSMKIFRSLAINGSQIVSVPLSAAVSGRTMDGLIGGFLGPAALGNFKITFRIFDLIQQSTLEPFKTASAPAFSKLFGNSGDLEKVYQQVIMVTAILVVPAFAGLGLTASVWVPLILGKQWVQTIPLFYVLSFNSIAIILSGFQISLLLAHRENKMVLWRNIMTTIVMGAAVFIGVQFDLYVTICIFVGVSYSLMFFNQFLIRKITGWGYFSCFKGMIAPVTGAVAMALVIEGIRMYGLPANQILSLIILIGAGGLTYAAVLFLILRRKLVPMIRQIIKRQPLIKAP